MFKYVLLIFRNMRRNLLQTAIVAMGTMMLVFIVTLIWSILHFMDSILAEKTSNVKAIVTEKWQIPSQMPFAYAESLSGGAADASKPGQVVPMDSMTWQFYGGTLDPSKQQREDLVFAFAMEPSKLKTMMEDLDNLKGAEAAELDKNIAAMQSNRLALLLGPEKLRQINKQVGDRIKLFSVNFRGIDLEFEIVGALPPGRYEQSAVMNRDYLNAALDAYKRDKGREHPMAQKSLNLVWLKVPDMDQFTRMTAQIESPGLYATPAVKVETASGGIASFLEAYKDIFWGMRWLLTPAILVTLSLIVSNAISVSVRQRRKELAVLKVLGFQPYQLLLLVLAEALTVGVVAGTVSGVGTYVVINNVFEGITFPIAFFPVFMIPKDAFLWGLGIGAITSLLGSIIPAWSARSVKAAEVFAKVA